MKLFAKLFQSLILRLLSALFSIAFPQPPMHPARANSARRPMRTGRVFEGEYRRIDEPSHW